MAVNKLCTRRQIDELKAAREQLAEDDPKRAVYEREISRCWRLYEARNQELAHLAANMLLLFATVWDCSFIGGESSRRSNPPDEAKACATSGATCPRCGKPAQTYRSPRQHHRSAPVKWGRWLVCAHCSYNADRDYCAAVNIARLGVAFLITAVWMSAVRGVLTIVDLGNGYPARYLPLL